MRSASFSAAIVLAVTSLAPAPAHAQTFADACTASQPQLAPKRAELEQVRAQIGRLDAAITAYREGIEFQQKNAIQGALDAAIAGYGTKITAVTKFVADSTLAVAAAFSPQVAAIEKAYQGGTDVLAAREALDNGHTGVATEKALKGVGKMLTGYEKGIQADSLTAAGVTRMAPASVNTASQNIAVAGGIVAGANALKNGDPGSACAAALGAAGTSVGGTGKDGLGILSSACAAASSSPDATASTRVAAGLDGSANVAALASALVMKASTKETLSSANKLLAAGATVARSQDAMFKHLDASADALDMRADIKDRATVTEAQFKAKMNAALAEKRQLEMMATRLEADVSGMEAAVDACASIQRAGVTPIESAPVPDSSSDGGYGGRYRSGGRYGSGGSSGSGTGFGGIISAVTAAGEAGRGTKTTESGNGGSPRAGSPRPPETTAPKSKPAPPPSSPPSGGCRSRSVGEGSCGER